MTDKAPRDSGLFNTERPDWSALTSMLDGMKQAWHGVGEVQQRMLALTGVAWSADRFVRAVVGPRGHLLELDIDPRVYRTPDSVALATTILETVRRAIEDVNRQSRRLLEEGALRHLRFPELGGGLDVGTYVESHDADWRKDGMHHG